MRLKRGSNRGSNDIFDHPSRILNADETAFALDSSGGRDQRVLSLRGEKVVQKGATGTKAHITALATINAAGHMFPPMMIFPGRAKNPDPHFVDMDGFPEAAYTASPNGWQTEYTFYQYVCQLKCWVEDEGIQFPVLLFLDGHKWNLGMKTIE